MKIRHINLRLDDLNEILHEIYLDEHFKYWFEEGTWNYHKIENDHLSDNKRWVIEDDDGEIIGFTGFTINKDTNTAKNFHIINFTKMFNRDVTDAFILILDWLFNKYNISQLQFNVTIGNPVEPFYDKFVKSCDGIVVGTFHKEVRLYTGEICDRKYYEMTKEGFNSSIYKKRADIIRKKWREKYKFGLT